MSAISSSVGLISGIPIEDTVNQLMQVAARPRATLQSRTDSLKSQQSALDQLSSLVLSLQFDTTALDRQSIYGTRTATSSNANAVSVSVAAGATPAVGSYQLTPLRAASAHQIVSGSLGGLGSALGTGELELQFGGRVNKGVALTQINGGTGFQAGSIKITDRAGETATIDLRAATSIDEVLYAINTSDGVDVTASVEGDRLVLIDNTGETGTLRVREVGAGTTAASLGLLGAGATTVDSKLTGGDIFGLSNSTKLASLNDGLGIAVNESEDIEDLKISLADGTIASINLSSAASLGDIISAVNDHEDLAGKVSISIAGDGNRIVVTDHTEGDETFLVEGSSADDLGIDSAAVDGVVTGKRLVSGLQSVLLDGLNGGQGVEAGSISITNRAGDPAVEVDLSAAETLNDVIAALNTAGEAIGVAARVNDNGTGILLTDTSGGSGPLVIAEAGDTTTAADLGLLGEQATGSFDTGTLNRQSVGRQTQLSTLRGGQGISRGQVRITDSDGKTSTVDLRFNGVDNPTLGDVIDRINASAVEVTASLNEAGDGILLTDDAGGTEKLSVVDFGSGTTASQLRLLGDSSTTDSQGRQTIDGTGRLSIDLESIESSAGETLLTSVNNGSGVQRGIMQITDTSGASATIDLSAAVTVQDVIDAINGAGVGVSAEINTAGTGIQVNDTADGSGTLAFNDITGSSAEDLRLTRAVSTTASGKQSINGVGLFEDGTPIQLLAKKINDFGGGFNASVVFDGVGYRLSIASAKTGSANEIVVTSSGSNIGFTESSRAADAVASFGQGGGGGVTVTSKDGAFNNVVSGLNINVKQATGEPVRLDVAQNDTPLRNAVQDFITSYNSIRDALAAVTDFDPDSLTTGILFGSNEAVRVDSELSRIVSGRFTTGSNFTSLESIGVSLDDKGKLSLNQAKFDEALASDRGAVERMFRDDKNGVAAKFKEATDRLAGDENSLLSARSISLTNTIDANNDRITRFDETLTRQRERMLTEFYKLEEVIAMMQANLDTVSGIQPISIQSYRNS
ncbi:fliD [Symbiodinium sp. KB8]|nr:fliD [Symbiodinium sp. KB8]